MAFSPDGKIIASASYDNTVRLWDLKTQKPLGEPLTGHSSYVRSVAFSPDGKTLASGSSDNTVRLWDVKLESWLKKSVQLLTVILVIKNGKNIWENNALMKKPALIYL